MLLATTIPDSWNSKLHNFVVQTSVVDRVGGDVKVVTIDPRRGLAGVLATLSVLDSRSLARICLNIYATDGATAQVLHKKVAAMKTPVVLLGGSSGDSSLMSDAAGCSGNKSNEMPAHEAHFRFRPLEHWVVEPHRVDPGSTVIVSFVSFFGYDKRDYVMNSSGLKVPGVAILASLTDAVRTALYWAPTSDLVSLVIKTVGGLALAICLRWYTVLMVGFVATIILGICMFHYGLYLPIATFLAVVLLHPLVDNVVEESRTARGVALFFISAGLFVVLTGWSVAAANKEQDVPRSLAFPLSTDWRGVGLLVNPDAP